NSRECLFVEEEVAEEEEVVEEEEVASTVEEVALTVVVDEVALEGEFMHPCEDDIVCKCKTEENKVPYFNAPVYLDNKEQIGKVDEIFGQLRDFVSFKKNFCVCHIIPSPCCTREDVTKSHKYHLYFSSFLILLMELYSCSFTLIQQSYYLFRDFCQGLLEKKVLPEEVVEEDVVVDVGEEEAVA
ncbi:H/ACA ribonucleoprotein complex subunit 1, partial [Lamprotornis superbus]